MFYQDVGRYVRRKYFNLIEYPNTHFLSFPITANDFQLILMFTENNHRKHKGRIEEKLFVYTGRSFQILRIFLLYMKQAQKGFRPISASWGFYGI